VSRNIQSEDQSIGGWLPRILIAGTVSTAVMTGVMEILYNMLPHREQYPLPPEEIATVIERKVFGKSLGESPHMAWTLISHFGYGIILAGVYSMVADRMPFRALLKGVLYGLAVWAGSYLGWLPALHIIPPATKHPPERNWLMLVAHVAWGAVLGITTSKF
jgi:uncharacterized membrane protein YagU involved in acid resistance